MVTKINHKTTSYVLNMKQIAKSPENNFEGSNIKLTAFLADRDKIHFRSNSHVCLSSYMLTLSQTRISHFVLSVTDLTQGLDMPCKISTTKLHTMHTLLQPVYIGSLLLFLCSYFFVLSHMCP